MGVTKKNKPVRKKKSVTDKAVPNYSADPYFIRKNEKASAFLKKAGLPDSFKNKKK